MNAIEVKGLRRTYGPVEAVRGIDFNVAVGQVFAFLGPNGAGKTTTVEILEGFRERSAGEVIVLGCDPGLKHSDLRSRIGIVLQECDFPRNATVTELIRLYAGYYRRPRPVGDVIELVGLEEKANSVIKTLSGGQRRRLDLALALVGDPELIFLDEPTTGFDPSARRGAWDVISNLRSLGKTIFLTTHYMEEAQYLADHVAIIANGEIVAEGPPDSLGGRDEAMAEIRFAVNDDSAIDSLPPLNGAVVERTGVAGRAGEIAGTGAAEGTAVTVLIRTAEPTPALHCLTEWALSRHDELHNLTVSRPSLEDIYLTLTSKEHP